MATPDQRVLQYLVSVETLAEDILAGERQLVELDRVAQGHRVAGRELRHGAGGGANSDNGKVWIGAAASLVRCSVPGALIYVQREEDKVKQQIKEKREEIKNKVNRLRDMEMKPPVPGLNLEPLTSQESRFLTSQ